MDTKNFLDFQQFLDTNRLWFGILFGWLFTRIMSLFQKATVRIEISADDREFDHSGKTYKFLNLIVKNRKPNPFKFFLFGRTNINNGRVWLTFKEYPSGIEALKINGRWASTKEPVDYDSGKPQIAEILLPSRDNVPVGEQANVSVAIKEKGENSFFAFNNESYFHNWKHPDFELDSKTYFVEVLLLADGKEYKEKLLLNNPSKSCRNFKISKQ